MPLPLPRRVHRAHHTDGRGIEREGQETTTKTIRQPGRDVVMEGEEEKEPLANKDVKSVKVNRKRLGLLLISRPECGNLWGRLR